MIDVAGACLVVLAYLAGCGTVFGFNWLIEWAAGAK